MDVEEIAKALKLKELSDLLETHNSLINETSEKVKSFDGVAAAISELVEKHKSLVEEVEALKTWVKEVDSVYERLSKSDETKIAEKAQRFTPFWGSGMQASKAVTTVLTDEKAASLAKPEVPNVIQKMSRKAMGGK
jgi:predicted nuclease with TOPRIM domain